MFEEKVGINYTIFEKYLLELKGPKTDNGKNNKSKDEATWRNVVKKMKWNKQRKKNKQQQQKHWNFPWRINGWITYEK